MGEASPFFSRFSRRVLSATNDSGWFTALLAQSLFVLLGVDLPFAVFGVLLEGSGDGAGELVRVDHEVFQLGEFGKAGRDVDGLDFYGFAITDAGCVAVVKVVDMEAEPFHVGEVADFSRDGACEVVVVKLEATEFLELANLGADASLQLVELKVQLFQVLKAIDFVGDMAMDEIVAEAEEFEFGEVFDAR